MSLASSFSPNVVALSADAAMFPAGVFLISRLMALNPRDDVSIALFSDSKPDLLAAKRYGLPARLIHADFIRRLPSAVDRIPGVAFARLFIPGLFGQEVKRILYVDVDIAVENQSVFGLFDLSMEDYPVAAVRDLHMTFGGTEEGKRELARISNKNGKYLQSGGILIDRARYQQQRVGDRAFRLAAKYRCHDQGALNMALDGKWLELSQAMNMISSVRNSFVSDVLPPAIIHFMGATKPWHATFAENHPIRAEMETYLSRTPWRGFVQRVPFSQAWDALQWDQGAPTRAARPERSRLPHTTDFAAIARHLGTALFADVEQGITKIRLDRLPARHIGSVQAT